MRAILALVLVLMGLSPVIAQIQRIQPGELLVQLEAGTTAETLVARLQSAHPRGTWRVEKQVSRWLNIHLLRFDPEWQPVKAALGIVLRQSGVKEAQVNHLLQHRKQQLEPNDIEFIKQWQWKNTGQNGGTQDADVDANEAWDITTGGSTTLGDEIVIAVLDDGFELNHPDLKDNMWVNPHEIPNNDLDDDGNGYIDDYLGYNIYSEDDAIGNGDHGVEVAGMIGATGNNGSGVTGMNWKVKIMGIKNYIDTDEAQVLAAYDYPLTLRKLYNATDGRKGAYVVATNASWGIDGADASEAPLWCAFYDSLGHAGILNIASTSNDRVNVDQVGDLPSTCTSPYLVMVTSSNNRDNINAATGKTHVDLAAPGSNIFTTAAGGNFTFTTGTSFASPLVAGLIGLLYSSPCGNLPALSKSSPPEAALLARSILLTSTDTILSMQDKVATGGRANAFKAIKKTLQGCGSCLPPVAIQLSALTDKSVTVSWQTTAPGISNVRLEYRIAGQSWNSINDATSPTQLQIQPCTNYELRLRSTCGNDTSGYSILTRFSADGCCEPPLDLQVTAQSGPNTTFQWSQKIAALQYELELIPDQKAAYKETIQLMGSITLALDSCTAYKARIRILCEGNVYSDWSPYISFGTQGCGTCTEKNYCLPTSTPSTIAEWIGQVQIGNFEHNSKDEGYLFYYERQAEVIAGERYDITLTPAYLDEIFAEQFEVFIDFNQDGSFDAATEKVIDASGITQAFTESVTIPKDAPTGYTRLRVRMNGFGNAGAPCNTIDFGEIEDYCVLVKAPGACSIPVFDISSTNKSVSVQLAQIPDEVTSVRLVLKTNTNVPLQEVRISTAGKSNTNYTFNLLDACTEYAVQLFTYCGNDSTSTGNRSVKTKGCLDCINLQYCDVAITNKQVIWIDQLVLNGTTVNSGLNNGYALNQSAVIALNAGTTYTATITKGFASFSGTSAVKIWLDANRDGDFLDPSEALVTSTYSDAETIQVDFTVPAGVSDGSSRLRIQLSPALDSVCGTLTDGDIEDYCVEQIATCRTPRWTNLVVGADTALIAWDLVQGSPTYSVRYRRLGESNWNNRSSNRNKIVLSGLTTCTEYEFQIQANCISGTGEWSAIDLFRSDCSVSSGRVPGIPGLIWYPNPVSHQLTLDFKESLSGNFQWQWIDLHGRLMGSGSDSLGNGTPKVIMDVPWNSGVYLLRIQHPAGTAVLKVMVQID